MDNKKKKIIIIAFVAVVAVLAIAGFFANRVKTSAGQKKFTITITSERDNFNKTIECTSDLGTLGEYVQTMEDCQWEASEYGTFITGWFGYEQDLDNQYWWAIYKDGEQDPNGADSMPLESGHDYEFILTQGW